MTSYERRILFGACVPMTFGFVAGMAFGFEFLLGSAPLIAATTSCYAMYLHLFDADGSAKQTEPPSDVEIASFSWGTAIFVGGFAVIHYAIGALLHREFL